MSNVRPTVTCTDPRIDAAAAFGNDPRDAHIIRNASGSGRVAFRSILIFQKVTETREIVLNKYTGCGLVTFANDKARQLVRGRLGQAVAEDVDTLEFSPRGGLDEAVRDGVQLFK